MNELTLKYGCNPNQVPARVFADGGLPFTVVLDAQGQIHWRHSGALDIEALRSMLKSGDLH